MNITMQETGNLNNTNRRLWLFSWSTDVFLLGLPVWLCWLICFQLSPAILANEISLWVWVLVVIGIDVSHVWSTLFRTYLDKDERKNHSKALIIAPIISFVVIFIIASLSVAYFWTFLAYLALYHFVKQQYGFMRLYVAKYGHTDFKKLISDNFIIYWGMLYPVFFWHVNYDRNFEWFTSGDFISLDLSAYEVLLNSINLIGNALFFAVLIIWWIEELWLYTSQKMQLPIGKWLWIITTAFNWYLGIIYFNSDLSFTLTNVVAHGIPYFVLIAIYIRNKNKISLGNRLSKIGTKYIFVIVFSVLILSFWEEYFWDMFIYNDNSTLFESIVSYPFTLLESRYVLALGLALLSLPQVTHYILDGFIWKSGKQNPFLKPAIL